MTTSDGIEYVQSVLREDSNSDRVTTLQLISAANIVMVVGIAAVGNPQSPILRIDRGAVYDQ